MVAKIPAITLVNGKSELSHESFSSQVLFTLFIGTEVVYKLDIVVKKLVVSVVVGVVVGVVVIVVVVTSKEIVFDDWLPKDAKIS